MSTTELELASFATYVRRQIDAGVRNLSIDELFDQWRAENPSDEQYAEDVAAVQASIEDYKNGDRGTIAAEHSAQLRSNYSASHK